jgi:two-component system cell cycle sensor histidine kinase/response regulator CckA
MTPETGGRRTPLRVLMLEDSVVDATLVEFELRKGPYDCTIKCVDGRAQFLDAIDTFVPQLILSDHRMGAFSGMHALQIAKHHAPDTPFLFVTGAIDEESASKYMAAGAWDYVLKDRLGRLVPAVRTALDLQEARESQRRAREQLMHSQKMDTLGRLASGIAHDYNNLTTAIIGYAALVMDTLPPGDPRRQDLEEVTRAGERAADLGTQLLAFSRSESVKFRRVSMNRVVSDTERLLRRLIGHGISVVTQLAPVLPPITAHSGQLQQVLINLAVNARDAMPGGGTLTIETSLDKSHQVRLSVTDTGTGMDAETQSRMFDAFFTTKAPGQGTGLGLAMVSDIVSAIGGEVSVESALGRGTAIHVLLPSTPGDDPAEAAAEEEFDALTGSETVLIADDDPAVRVLASRVLKNYGYTTIEAATGPEAVRAAATAMEIDLLFTDVGLSESGQPELFAEVRKHHPEIRVIFVPKPFQPKALVRAVRAELNRFNPVA